MTQIHEPSGPAATSTAEAQVESLRSARAKLAKIVEIYAPMGASRASTLQLMGAALIEFEAAVREDERAKTGAEVAILEAQTRALDASAAAAKANGFTPPPAELVAVEPKAAPIAPMEAPPAAATPSSEALAAQSGGTPAAAPVPVPPAEASAKGKRSK